MLLSGFTFIRNAQKYDFPIRECIESMLPIVDELVVNLGNSDDDTEKIVESICSPKIRLIRSVWDDSKIDRGLVLSEQTNIALDACRGDWALYLQADEALHEGELAGIRAAVDSADSTVDGIRFKYLHFYGGYSLVQHPWNWYPSEIRLIRRASGARSFGDAQTFRKPDGSMLNTKLIDAHVFHYGHAREPEVMAQKIRYFHRFWHGDDHGIKVDQAYKSDIKNLVWYWGTHPAVYRDRIAAGANWSPTPEKLVAKNFERIVIFYGKGERDLAGLLKGFIEAHSKARVIAIGSLWAWLKLMLSSAFRLKLRKSSALVDLCAESRPLLVFGCWILDARVAFSWRVAHSPSGKLSGFRKFFYDAISWGRHEKASEGFAVPENDQPRQIARWLGIVDVKR